MGPGPRWPAVGKSAAEKVEVAGDPEGIIRRIEAAKEAIVLLTTGDPMFYGTARFLCDRLGRGGSRSPHVQHAARLRPREGKLGRGSLTNLHQAARLRVARRPHRARSAIPGGIRRAMSPALLDRRIDYFTAYVCENLGSPDECVTQGELAEVAAQEFRRST